MQALPLLATLFALGISIWAFVKFIILCDDISAIRKKYVDGATSSQIPTPIQKNDTNDERKKQLTIQTENRLISVLKNAESSMFNRSVDNTLTMVSQIIDEYNARLSAEDLGEAPTHLANVDNFFTFYNDNYSK
jgi:hypothetical protein